MEVIFHKNFCPKVIGSGFKNFTHTIKICKKKSMTAMIKFLSEDIFSDRDKNGSDVSKKIDVFQPNTTNLRHDRAQI